MTVSDVVEVSHFDVASVDGASHERFINRELSWLAFNERFEEQVRPVFDDELDCPVEA